MDYMMPTLDGYQTTLKIREMMDIKRVPQAIIICVSGNTEEEDRE